MREIIHKRHPLLTALAIFGISMFLFLIAVTIDLTLNQGKLFWGVLNAYHEALPKKRVQPIPSISFEQIDAGVEWTLDLLNKLLAVGGGIFGVVTFLKKPKARTRTKA